MADLFALGAFRPPAGGAVSDPIPRYPTTRDGGTAPGRDPAVTLANGLDNRTGEMTAAESRPARSEGGDVLSRVLDTALGGVVDQLAAVFSLTGLEPPAAKEAAQGLLSTLGRLAAQADEVRFSFSAAIGTRTRTEIGYSGAGGVAAGVQEQASLEMRSLDIYINNRTGEMSVDFSALSMSVSRTEVVARGATPGGALAAMGRVFDGLAAPAVALAGAPEAGVFADPLGKGIADFIGRLLDRPIDDDPAAQAVATAAEAARERAAVLLRSIEPVADPQGSTDPFSRLRLDLSIPLGRTTDQPGGFEDIAGTRHQTGDPRDQVDTHA